MNIISKCISLCTLLFVFTAAMAQTEIRTVEELKAIGKDKNTMESPYILLSDITVEDWIPIGGIDGTDGEGFCGTLDGNGHTITINSFNDAIDNTRVGIFGLIAEKGVVKNLRVAGGISYTGGQKFLYIGGIAGFNKGLITCCVSSVELTYNYVKAQTNKKAIPQYGYEGGQYGGCIAGINLGIITHSYSDGAIQMVSSTQFIPGVAAGIAGCNGRPSQLGVKFTGGIAYCYSVASVSAPCACGIVGYNHPENTTLNNCVALNRLLESKGNAPKATPLTANVPLAISHPNFQYHYRDDIVINQYDGKGKEKPVKLSTKCAVAFSTTQSESWWRMPDGLPEKEHKKVLGFPFGKDETAPWEWSEALKRPILYWEKQ